MPATFPLLLTLNPFDMRGPDFLGFYVMLLVLGVIGSLVIKWLAGTMSNTASLATPSDLDPYEIAYLAGGRDRVLLVAMNKLIKQRAIEVKNTKLTVHASPTDQTHPVERAFLAAGPNIRMTAARSLVQRRCQNLHHSLQSQNLLVPAASMKLSRAITAMMFIVILVIGITKIAIGVDRGRPVGFLVILCFATIVLMIAMLKHGPFRTSAGSALLDKLRSTTRTKMPQPIGMDAYQLGTLMAMSTALYGMDSLISEPHYKQIKQAMAQSDPSSYSSSGSSCGGSSCGGSSCGGSSCGGGGCGGCGGS